MTQRECSAGCEPTGVVGRYAPSPTGVLHLGNLRTALVAWLAARLAGGTFVLRVEDIDVPRTVPGCESRQLADLEWLGLTWDGPVVRQSERGEIYRELFEQLRREGICYPCICSRRDLEQAGSAPHGPDGPAYPGTCRRRPLDEIARHPAGAAWRLMMPPGLHAFTDEICGRCEVDGAELGDFVVLRRDGLWAYQWACAVDDALQSVTQVVRGADLLHSTFRQCAIQRALGLGSPQEWWHLPLMNGPGGARLAKRGGADGLERQRSLGRTAADVVGELAAGLGLVPSGARLTAGELLRSIGRADLVAACRRSAEAGSGGGPGQNRL
jgi:glutamyl-tRNA synthetase